MDIITNISYYETQIILYNLKALNYNDLGLFYWFYNLIPLSINIKNLKSSLLMQG